ncbi:DsrE/DsrF/DrsH-like family protein [Magnetospirillum sulfuroxidans]|uniref:DsrE/DsrF/DrsH-like family protein n=1 Tax=Magnetospirillum sulfuroxidans TaxID=611300 RepID=A0ABS5IF41_9PROT|nr:DsrE/DsrF/DrsH-like family protein [Magnetospirillum sulfuroxidans]MBR9973031.1 DsrE/DsrF/DrsH-like family protein [Magnetospirillum sulfuroxidans]
MPAADKTSPDKVSIVVFSGDFDKIHYALVMAAAAVASNTPVTLFFTMWAGRALERDQAWKRLKCSDGSSAHDMDSCFKDKNVADFETLLAACVALDVTFMVCEMGVKALGMDPDDFRPDVPLAKGGIVTFLADASKDGAMIFV